MLKVAICLAALVCSSYGLPSTRIVNGQNARQGEFKYVVSLRNNLRHTCGATIINERFILTAAHCICTGNQPNNPSTYSIQYGSIHISQTAERSVPVSRIVCHDFNERTLENDIAVVELAHALPHDGSWEPVRLAREFDTSSREQEGTVVGWGRLFHEGPIPETLQKLDVTIFTNLICGLRFNNFQHICFGAAPGAGVCNGDSGTSLIVDGVQVGVASFITATCGTTSRLTPNVYARVPSFLPWIESHARL